MSNVITPTVGRKVWYRPSERELHESVLINALPGQPFDATIIAVHGDRCVNLDICDSYGTRYARHSVLLLQDGEQAPVGTSEGYAEWMPYQTKAAAREPVLDALAGSQHPLKAGIVPLDAQGVAITGSVGDYLTGKTDHHPV